MDIDNCFLGISMKERNYPVYRIIGLSRLYELFEKRANVLVKPHKWDDPFENFMVNVKARLPTGEVVEFGQRHEFYGQCWSLKASSDAMWRIYSMDARSVRIKVRIRKLVETLAATARGEVFAGKVRYMTSTALLAWAKRALQREQAPHVRLLAKTLLVKRTAFSHEQEIRLLYFEPGDLQPSLFTYRVDPHDLIEDIVVDPRLPVPEARNVIAAIQSVTGFRGRVTHSDLYATPSELTLRLGRAYVAIPRSSKRVSYEGDLRRVVYLKGANTQLILPTGREQRRPR